MMSGGVGYGTAVAPLWIREATTGSNCGLFRLALLLGVCLAAPAAAGTLWLTEVLWRRRAAGEVPPRVNFGCAYAGGMFAGCVVACRFLPR